MFKLLSSEERKKAHCFNCGTKVSVKYAKTVNGKEKTYCNRCVLLINNEPSNDEFISDLQMEQREQM